MNRSVSHRLGDLQLRILKIIWSQRDATIAQIHDALGGSAAFAYTTVATMLRKMELRGLVKHHEAGRSFIYQALVAADEVSRGATDHLIDRLFSGSLTKVVNHLLTTREVSEQELNELEQLIADRRKK